MKNLQSYFENVQKRGDKIVNLIGNSSFIIFMSCVTWALFFVLPSRDIFDASIPFLIGLVIFMGLVPLSSEIKEVWEGKAEKIRCKIEALKNLKRQIEIWEDLLSGLGNRGILIFHEKEKNYPLKLENEYFQKAWTFHNQAYFEEKPNPAKKMEIEIVRMHGERARMHSEIIAGIVALEKSSIMRLGNKVKIPIFKTA